MCTYLFWTVILSVQDFMCTAFKMSNFWYLEYWRQLLQFLFIQYLEDLPPFNSLFYCPLRRREGILLFTSRLVCPSVTFSFRSITGERLDLPFSNLVCTSILGCRISSSYICATYFELTYKKSFREHNVLLLTSNFRYECKVLCGL